MEWCRMSWLYSLTVGLLVSLLRTSLCEEYTIHTIHLNSTTNVTMDVHLGDRVKIDCSGYTYNNILYVRAEQQLHECNTSSIPAGYEQFPTSYINVGACIGSAIPSFNIDIKRISGNLATTIPFQMGQTYHFTSFTNGSAISAAAKPTAGGDCMKGLAIVIHVIDPDATPEPPTVITSNTTPSTDVSPLPSSTTPKTGDNPEVEVEEEEGVSVDELQPLAISSSAGSILLHHKTISLLSLIFSSTTLLFTFLSVL